MIDPLFISFIHSGKERTGFTQEGKTYLLPYKDMYECIASDFSTSKKKEIDPSEIRHKAPIIPSKIVCLGWNYGKHISELKAEDHKPIIFLKPPSSVIGPEEKIVLPAFSKQVEHEIELGIVIGKEGKRIRADKAEGHIAGYTMILDITARDLQWEARKKGDPWDVCKGFDTFAPIGPGVVPGKNISDVTDLSLELRVNGKTRQRSNTRDMIKKPAEIVSYISEYMTLKAGDVIATGTPEGVGPIEDGDVIDSEIEKIGKMRNYVVRD